MRLPDRLNQLPAKTEELLRRLLTEVPVERISAQEALQHPYFATLPTPIMHLRDSERRRHGATATRQHRQALLKK